MRARLRTLMLRAIARVSAPFAARSPSDGPQAVRRVLLIRPDHIGDVLFATPAIRALRASLPEAHIDCMVGPWAREIVQDNPHLDEVLTCPFPGFARRPKKHLLDPYLVLWSYAPRLRNQRYDLALILRFDHWWGAMLALWAGVPERIGYAVPETAPFLSQALPYASGRHEVEQNMSLIEAVTGVRVVDPGPLEFTPSPEAARSAEMLLAEKDPRQGYLCLHPGSGAPVKLWRPEAFAQVANDLAERYDLQVVITGSAGEQPLVNSIVDRMEREPLVIAGQTSLSELAALMARCTLVLGVDSGPLHLAVSQGVPTVHLYGPVDHHAFGPWGDPGKHLVVVSEKSCIPCNRLDYPAHELEEHDCVRSITAESVLKAAETLLKRHSQASGGMV
jgi:lipopolysaccharide heptosyltransferase II